MHIFLARNNVQAGPYTLEQLNQMLTSGQVIASDLMWHEGMENWQTVAEMTQGQLFYRPNLSSNLPNITANTQDEEDHIITRLPTTEQQADNVWDKYGKPNPHKEPNSADRPTITIKLVKKPMHTDISQAKKQLELASIGSRIVAKMIDFAFFILASMPLFIALVNSPSWAKMQAIAETGKRITFNQQVELLSVIPQHIILLTNLLVWGLIIAQFLLLRKRGQTLGKMIMGIRILDKQSNAIPSFFNLIILRSVLTMGLYTLPMFGMMMFALDFILMLSKKDRQSLHDKIAKTYVVRADDTQTTPLELTPD